MRRTMKYLSLTLAALMMIWSAARGKSAAEKVADKKPAVIVVRLPAKAELFIGGVKTKQQSAVREFDTPPLSIGKKYSYPLKAIWKDGDKEEVRETTIIVQAGETKEVDLLELKPPVPSAEKIPAPELRSEPQVKQEPKSKPKQEPELKIGAKPDSKKKPEAKKETGKKPEPKPESEKKPEAKSRSEKRPEPKPVPITKIDVKREPKKEPESKPVPKKKLESKPEPEKKADPLPKLKQNPEPKLEPITKIEFKPEPKKEPKPKQEPEKQSEPKPESTKKPEPENKPATKKSPEPKAKPERKPETTPPPKGTFAVRMPETLHLQPGGIKLLPIKVFRTDCQGPVSIQFEGLPPSVELKEASIPADKQKVYIMAAAPPEAAEKEWDVNVIARSGTLRQEKSLKIKVGK